MEDKNPHDLESSPLSSVDKRQENQPLPGVHLPRTIGYKSWNLGLFRIPYYYSPKAQLIIVAFVCFLCPGMFNALSGMGGGGQLDTLTVNAANSTLNGVFGIVAFFSGSITNKVGIRAALSFGGLGYVVYISSFLSYNFDSNRGFCIFAGALLGACAGMLWTAQGAIMMSYPKERSKGRYISWFWIIFNFGGVLGGLIPLGTNLHRSEAASVTNGTYIGFMILTFLGALLAFCLAPAQDVIRTDGSKVIVMRHPTWKSEFRGMFAVLKTDPYIVFLFPMFWSSNWFYTYQNNCVNAAYFTVRTRALNSILYWFMQIIGAGIFGYSLDYRGLDRPIKAKICWCALLVFTMVIWGGGYAFEKQFTRQSVKEPTFKAMDWSHRGFLGPMFLYMFYGFFDAIWQTSVYWLMGSLTNNGRKLANFAGFYKGVQSIGACVAFGVDAGKVPYVNEFASCWALLACSLFLATPLVFRKIQSSVLLEDDLKFSDKTYDEVAPVGDLARSNRSGS